MSPDSNGMVRRLAAAFAGLKHPRRRREVATGQLEIPEAARDLLDAWMNLRGELRPSHQELRWAMDGGTVLAARWHHRESNDVDVFYSEADWHERLGEAGANELGRLAHERGYHETRVRKGMVLISPVPTRGGEGKIDVVALTARAGPISGKYWIKRQERVEALDTGVILAGKLIHRGLHARDRDLYDLAVALKREPEEARKAFDTLTRKELEDQRREVRRQRGNLRAEGLRAPTDEEAVRNAAAMVIEEYSEAGRRLARRMAAQKEEKEWSR